MWGRLVQHLAVIMDGNGRWAKQRLMPRIAGHRKGADAARKLIEVCPKHGINFLTLYAFSSENWRRPEDEVKELMGLLSHYLDQNLEELHHNGVVLRFIGNRAKLPADIQTRMIHAEQLTAANTNLHLNVALSYGAREEITTALQRIATQIQLGAMQPEQITEATIAEHLFTHHSPDPDLLIRTGGEHRISNFLLWQSAYTEFYFSDVLWPDFNESALVDALEDFAKRERRFGKTSEQLKA